MSPMAEIEIPPRKRFTQREIERMADHGLFEGQRNELIDGDLIDKTGQSPAHAYTIGAVMDWLAGIFGAVRVRCQLPIEAGVGDREHSLPEPDLSVLIGTRSDYRARHPGGDELQMLVEVSEESPRFDLTVKAALYARAGVPEYWVLDLAARALTMHRHPSDGEYGQTIWLSETEQADIAARPDIAVAVSSLLPESPG